MYDLPVLRRATDSWWTGLTWHFRRLGVPDVPEHLSRPGEGFEFWLAPDLLLSQTCGYPLVTVLAERATLLGTPCYGFDGCDGPNYCSFIIVRADCPADSISALRDHCCAVNLAESWSGHHALRLAAQTLIDDGKPNFEIVQSGSHIASIEAVRSGTADFAAVDCVLFGLLTRHQPQQTNMLRILARTPPMPGLPLIAGAAATNEDIRCMKQGLRAAFDDPELDSVRKLLQLKGFQFTTMANYHRMSLALGRLGEQRVPLFV